MAGTPKDYEILGLPEDAPRELVERKYGALLRSYKQRTDEQGVTDEDVAYYQRITQAYDNIVGTVHDFRDPNPTSPLPFGFRNFFYKLSANLDHHKFLLMGILMVIVLVVLVRMQLRSTRRDDLHIKFVGAFSTDVTDSTALQREINERSDVTKSPDVSFFSVTVNTTMTDSQATNAAVQFRAQFMGGAIDVILIDRDNFDVYMPQLVFLDLTEFLEENAGEPGFSDLVLYRHENAGGEDQLPSGIYGIEFTEGGSAYFDGMKLDWLNDALDGQDRSMILAICRTSPNRDIAEDFLQEMIRYVAQQD